MRKSFSFISLVAMGCFMITTFATSKFQSGFGTDDKFGYPFVFFSAFNEGEVLQNKVFSASALITDFAIYFVAAYVIVSVLSLLRIERKKNPNLVHDTTN